MKLIFSIAFLACTIMSMSLATSSISQVQCQKEFQRVICELSVKRLDISSGFTFEPTAIGMNATFTAKDKSCNVAAVNYRKISTCNQGCSIKSCSDIN
jgi:hypothetical protein